MKTFRQSGLLLVFLACVVLARPTLSQTPSSSQRHPISGTSTRRNDLSRRIQSWMIKQKAIPKTRSLGQRNTLKTESKRGSVLTFQKPTKANIGRWFGVTEDPGNLRSMLRREFNHDAVGMTNPCLHISSQQQSHNNLRLQEAQSSQEVVIDAVATAGSEMRAKTNAPKWWPSLSFSPSQPKKWRILTYRRKIGRGLDCYQRVRDAAMDWEFQTDNDMGLVSVPSVSNNPFHTSAPSNNNLVVRGRYTVTSSDDTAEDAASANYEAVALHQCIGAARRFVSYSAKRVVPFLPKIYSVNPVMVVYDVVDQRGPATMFSSTAYATMKGHLLRGEERVTVALRDGTEDVEVEIVSVSRAGPSAKGRVVWPFIGKMQSTFFESQMEFLQKVGGQSDKSSQPFIQECSNRRIAP